MSDQENGKGHESPQTLLERLGALRDERVAETVRSFPLPNTQGFLWATYRLKGLEDRVPQVVTMLMSGQKGALSAATNLLADSLTELFMAHGVSEDNEPVDRVEFPGCEDVPMALDERLESMAPKLCPPRPGGKAHTPATRIRAVIGSDTLVNAHALAVCGWAMGGAEKSGAIQQVSEAFVGE